MKINSTEVKNLEPIKTIAIHHVGDYSELGIAFNKIVEWAGKNDYWAKGPRMIGIYHDNPALVPAEKLRSSACLEDMGGVELAHGMERYMISGGKYLVMNAEVIMAEYGDAWCKIYADAANRGLEIDSRDQYEVYLSCIDETQGDDAPWIVEFCVAVK